MIADKHLLNIAGNVSMLEEVSYNIAALKDSSLYTVNSIARREQQEKALKIAKV